MADSSGRTPSVLLATCADLPDLDEDARVLQRALAARGVDARPAVWTDPALDWSAADAVVLRTTWDYARRRTAFLAWAEHVASVSRLLNPVDLVRWSTDKVYLLDLAEAGVPVVHTEVVTALAPTGPAHGLLDVEHVVKPTVSAGSVDTTRVAAGDEARSRGCVAAILRSGRAAMVQPYVAGVDELGETALVCFDQQFSHALRKGPLLPRGHRTATADNGLFVEEDMSPRDPSADELALAEQVLGVVAQRFGTPPAYARVDLLPSDDGPLLLELELVEPSFFLDLVPSAAARAADAIARRL